MSRHPLHHCYAPGTVLKASSTVKKASQCCKVSMLVSLRDSDGLHLYLEVALPRLGLFCP